MLLLIAILAACALPARAHPAQEDETGEPLLVAIQITAPGFKVENAVGGGVTGTLSVLVPAIHKEAVAEARSTLEAVLRKDIRIRRWSYSGYCSETPWLVQDDHSKLSLGTCLLAARWITRFNEALGEDLVWGFECDLWNYETRPILKDGSMTEGGNGESIP